MESKDPLLQLDSAPLRPRPAKLPALTIDPVPARTREPAHEDDVAVVADSSASSPSPSMSPRTPADNVPLSASSEGAPDSPLTTDGPSSTKEPASGPQRTRSASNAAGKAADREPREKRKRSRVTPEQLTHLERFFSADRSPTAARRKEISDLLGMQERQTQIWFQNRRAKAKLLDGKKPRHGDWSDTPPDTPPQLSAGFEADLHSLIHEDQPVSIIPCTDLSVGTWRRIATNKHDLVAYVCEPKRCLTWFIHSAGYGFKMEIAFDIIIDTEFRSLSPGEGLASFILSQPPQFYLENMVSPRSAGIALGVGPSSTSASSSAGPVIKTWKKCSDWTEGTQASHVLRHDLIGSAVQLVHVLNDLREYRTRASIPLLNPSMYTTQGGAPDLTSPTTLQIPQPPLSAIQPPDGYSLQPPPPLQRSAFMSHFRKRSSSGPPAFKQDLSSPYPGHQMPPISTGMDAPHSASYASTSFDRQAALSAFSYGQRSISDYAPGGVSAASYLHQPMHEPSVPETSSVPISHGASHRPFPTGQYFHPGRTSPTYHALQQQQHDNTGLGSQQQQQYVTPSPPLLSSPYATGTTSGSGTSSAPTLPDIGTLAQPRSSSTDAVHVSGNAPMGLSGMPYFGQDDARRYAGQ